MLRVHTFQAYTDSADLFGAGGAATFDLNTYTWYTPNYHSALMTINTAVGTGLTTGFYFKTVSYAFRQLSNAGVHPVDNIGESLQIFPNPAGNELNINFNAGTGEHVRINMVDMLGRDVAVIADQAAQGMQNITYNTGSLSKGLYLVRLQSGNETATRQIVIQ